jgi:hypothetical protein
MSRKENQPMYKPYDPRLPIYTYWHNGQPRHLQRFGLCTLLINAIQNDPHLIGALDLTEAIAQVNWRDEEMVKKMRTENPAQSIFSERLNAYVVPRYTYMNGWTADIWHETNGLLLQSDEFTCYPETAIRYAIQEYDEITKKEK